MHKPTFYLLLTSLFCGFSLFGQRTRETISFRLTPHNNILVPALLNGTDSVTLMFHTASSSLTLTEDAVKKLRSLRFEGSDRVDSWGGGTSGSRYSPGNRLQIGSLHWENLPLWENQFSGPGSDGKFGLDLFAGKTTEIDFDHNRIILYDSLPRKAKHFEKHELVFENGMPFLEAACEIDGKPIRNRFLIHSGYAGSVLLDDAFVSQNPALGRLEVIAENELKDSFGNILKTKKAVMPAFIIGTQRLENIPVGYFEGSVGRQKMSILGGDLLKRFHILIDAKHGHIYLKPGRLAKTPYANV